MMQAFFETWHLYKHAWLSGMMAAGALSMIGVLVVARNQIFIGAAVSSASTLGVAIALALAGWLGIEDHDAGAAALITGSSVLAAILASLIAQWRGGRGGGQMHEAITGWVYLLAITLSVLLLVHSGQSHEQAHRKLEASLLTALDVDTWIFAGLLLITAGLIAARRSSLMLLVMDGQTAGALGVRVNLWNPLLAIWLGISLGLTQRVAGMIFAFGALILPALIARGLTRRVMPIFWLAPLIAACGALAAFILANHYDFPPAHTVVALWSLLLIPSWFYSSVRR